MEQVRRTLAECLKTAVTITMIRGEPTLVFWRVPDLREGLRAANDMGLALTCPRSVTDRIFGLLVDDEREASMVAGGDTSGLRNRVQGGAETTTAITDASRQRARQPTNWTVLEPTEAVGGLGGFDTGPVATVT